MSYASLDELKAHCNVDFDDDDDALQGYLDGATEYSQHRPVQCLLRHLLRSIRQVSTLLEI